MDMNLQIVGVVVAISIIAVVGISLVDSFSTASDVNNIETFGVTDPSADRTCGLEYEPVDSSVTVRYYNGTAWKTLTSADYTLTGSTLVVSNSAME